MSSINGLSAARRQTSPLREQPGSIMTDLVHLEGQMTAWRRDLHRHPEFGFEEHRTASFVAETLRGMGIQVAEGIGGTGVVGTLKRGTSNPAIALRADMDALRITRRRACPGLRIASGQCTPAVMMGTPPCCCGLPAF